MKNKFKLLSLISGIIIILSAPLIAVSCSTASQPADQVGNSLIRDGDATSATQFINDRTMSLRFDYDEYDQKTQKTERWSSWGTGWIFDKDLSMLNTYYIATNMHVINAMNEGLPGSYSYWYGTGSIGSTLNSTDYVPIYNIQKIELGKYKQPVIGVPYLLDFGLLKIDFGRPNSLTTAYDNNPTMFYTAPKKNDMIYTSGFPAIADPDQYGDQVRWRQYKNKINDFWYNGPNYTADKSIIYDKVQYYSAATNGIISTLNMGGGSSGSMVIEENSTKTKFYVIGIYWGGYTYKDSSKFDGAFNLINGSTNQSTKNPYNIIDLWIDYCKANRITTQLRRDQNNDVVNTLS